MTILGGTIIIPQMIIAMVSGVLAAMFIIFTWLYSTHIPNDAEIDNPHTKGWLKGFILCWLFGEVCVAVFIASGLLYFQLYFPKIVVVP